MELLTLLVESNGQLVTRDQIIERIWGKGVFLDTEHGINTAIRKIRLALGDNPEQPRFVQTVTGKGYRFITPTIEISGGGNGSATGADSSSAVDAPDAIGSKLVLEQKAAPVPQKDSNAGKPSALSLAIFGTLALLALAAALVGMNVAGWRDQIFARRPKPNIQALAVLPLTNLSGDPEQDYFADGMTEALITELGKMSNSACHLAAIDNAVQGQQEGVVRDCPRTERGCSLGGHCRTLWRSGAGECPPGAGFSREPGLGQ